MTYVDVYPDRVTDENLAIEGQLKRADAIMESIQGAMQYCDRAARFAGKDEWRKLRTEWQGKYDYFQKRLQLVGIDNEHVNNIWRGSDAQATRAML
jgi:hypothetical protein